MEALIILGIVAIAALTYVCFKYANKGQNQKTISQVSNNGLPPRDARGRFIKTS